MSPGPKLRSPDSIICQLSLLPTLLEKSTYFLGIVAQKPQVSLLTQLSTSLNAEGHVHFSSGAATGQCVGGAKEWCELDSWASQLPSSLASLSAEEEGPSPGRRGLCLTPAPDPGSYLGGNT